MTQQTCGICDRKPSEHSLDQIHKCFSDAGHEIEFTVADALHYAREFELIKKYSPGLRGYPAKVWFQDDPSNMVETDDLPETIFIKALPLLEPQEKKDGGKSSDEKPEEEGRAGTGNADPDEDEPEDDRVWDDETLARMEDSSDKSEG